MLICLRTVVILAAFTQLLGSFVIPLSQKTNEGYDL